VAEEPPVVTVVAREALERLGAVELGADAQVLVRGHEVAGPDRSHAEHRVAGDREHGVVGPLREAAEDREKLLGPLAVAARDVDAHDAVQDGVGDGLAELLGEASRAREGSLDLVGSVALGREERHAERGDEVDLLAAALRRFGHRLEQTEPAPELLGRLRVRCAPEGALARPLPVGRGGRCLPRVLEVLRQQLGLPLLQIGEALAERGRDAPVELPAARAGHRLIGGLADERVLEDVALAPQAAPGIDEAGVAKLLHVLPEERLLLWRHRAQKLVAELPPEHGRKLCSVVGALGQVVQARAEQRAEARRDLEGDALACQIPMLSGQRARLDEGSRHLLDEERDAVRALHDLLDQRSRQRPPSRETDRDHLLDLLAAEAGCLDHRHVVERPRRAELGPRGEHGAEVRRRLARCNLRRAHLLHEQPCQLERRRVGPVQVLEHERDRTLLGHPQEEPHDGIQGQLLLAVWREPRRRVAVVRR
jgi:hypothetical protein